MVSPFRLKLACCGQNVLLNALAIRLVSMADLFSAIILGRKAQTYNLQLECNVYVCFRSLGSF